MGFCVAALLDQRHRVVGGMPDLPEFTLRCACDVAVAGVAWRSRQLDYANSHLTEKLQSPPLTNM